MRTATTRTRSCADPIGRCLLAGVPRFAFLRPFRIIQNPEYVLFLYQFEHAFRESRWTGVRTLRRTSSCGGRLAQPLGGKYVALWTSPITTRAPAFDQAGAYHSDALHVVERFTFVDANTINCEATLEDPKAYTRPWKIAFTHKRTRRTRV